MNFQNPDDTICALSTPQGVGAISLIRLSGRETLNIVEQVFSKKISNVPSHTAHFGSIKDGQQVVDEVLLNVFKNPNSFTGEDLVEIGCHGSKFIQSEILRLLIDKGARLAGPGEFSLRAYLNGKMDLSQTEAIADLISANSAAAHRVAMHQMRGGFSSEIDELRQELMNFASLIELELDFSEEDVEFADRTQLEELLGKIKKRVNSLLHSFQLGNVIKNGVPVAIVGAPNAGKSTLLNALLNEDKAIVSEIAGTTRDVIEDTVILEGVEFRFIDTAGIRETSDEIESLGIERAFQQIKAARIVLLIFDLIDAESDIIIEQINNFKDKSISDDQHLICLFNKEDVSSADKFKELKTRGIFISARNGNAIEGLKKELIAEVGEVNMQSDNIVTNVRHYEILQKCSTSIEKIETGLKNQIPGDLLAMDIRETLDLLGEITGNISSDELLGNIFGKFCIGK